MNGQVNDKHAITVTKIGDTTVHGGQPHSWRLVESGYYRMWSVDVDPDKRTVTAYFGGSEDWSETGAGDDHLECHCGAVADLPADWEVVFE